MNTTVKRLIKDAGLDLKPRERYDEYYEVSDLEHFDENLSVVRCFFDGGAEELVKLVVQECIAVADKALQDGKWPGDELKKHFDYE